MKPDSPAGDTAGAKRLIGKPSNVSASELNAFVENVTGSIAGGEDFGRDYRTTASAAMTPPTTAVNARSAIRLERAFPPRPCPARSVAACCLPAPAGRTWDREFADIQPRIGFACN